MAASGAAVAGAPGRAARIPAAHTIAVARPPIGDFQVALDDAGDAAVAWKADSAEGFAPLFVRSRPGGGAFGPPVAVSDPRADAGSIALAIAPDGTEIALWVAAPPGPPGPAHELWGRVRPRDGDWGPLERVSTGGAADEPAVAFRPDGTAVVAWLDEAKDVTRVELRERNRVGVWSSPLRLSSGPREVSRPQISLDGAGDATVAWERAGPPLHAIRTRASRSRIGQAAILATVVRVDGTRSGTRVLSDRRRDSGDAVIAQNSRGDAAVFWVSNVGDRFRIDYALRSRLGRFGRWRPLTRPRDDATEPLAAIDESANLVVAWRQLTRPAARGCNCFRAFAVWRRHGANFSPPRVATPADVDGFTLAGNNRGQAVLLWNSQGRRTQRVEARRLTTAGRLRPIRTLSRSPADTDIRAGMNGRGEAIVAWTRRLHRRDRLELVDRSP
ncbi:MAG: hypothetical protein ACJ76Z_14010 [Thermoleophilaceae bacterium]